MQSPWWRSGLESIIMNNLLKFKKLLLSLKATKIFALLVAVVLISMIVYLNTRINGLTLELSASQQKAIPTETPAPTVTPTPTVVFKTQVRPSNTPTIAPLPTKTVNTGKTEALKMNEEKIAQIDQAISSLQSAIDGTLKNEQEQCNLPEEPLTTSEGRILDPGIQLMREYNCSQGYFDVVNDLRQKISILAFEKNALERQKIQIVAQ